MSRSIVYRHRATAILLLLVLILITTVKPAWCLSASDFPPGSVPTQTSWQSWENFFFFYLYFGSIIGLCIYGVRRGMNFIEVVCVSIFLTPIAGALFVYFWKPASETKKN